MMKFKPVRIFSATIGIPLFLMLSSFTQQQPLTNQAPFKFKTVVIDAGHGGKDPGAHGSFSLEKNVVLAIAKKLRNAVGQDIPDLKVVMTRSDDTFIELNQRSEIANKNAGNLFISIHCNSSPEGTANSPGNRGVLLLLYGFHRNQEQMEAIRENASIYIEKDYQKKYDYNENDPTSLIILNAFRQKYRKHSVQFAELLNQQFKENDNRHSLGVKEQGVLVLAHSAMPAVLIETGFINNTKDEKYLNSEAGQDAIVHSIIAALRKYKGSLTPQQ